MTYDLKFFINAQIRIFKTNGTFHNFVKKKTPKTHPPQKPPQNPQNTNHYLSFRLVYSSLNTLNFQIRNIVDIGYKLNIMTHVFCLWRFAKMSTYYFACTIHVSGLLQKYQNTILISYVNVMLFYSTIFYMYIWKIFTSNTCAVSISCGKYFL